MKRSTRTIGLAGLALAATTVIGVPAASAKDGDVKTRGTCSAGSEWKLKLGPRDGGIETEFEVDSNVVGQVWKVTLTQNGTLVAQGRATTTAPSGSFEFDRRLANPAGTDTVVATATNRKTGESCTGQASV